MESLFQATMQSIFVFRSVTPITPMFKGQLISKFRLGVFNSPKKQTKTIRLMMYHGSKVNFFGFGRIQDT